MNKYGLIGRHLSHSFSPKLHEIIFKNSGIDGEYKLFESEVKQLGELVGKLTSLEIKGFNVTIPYKLEMLKYIDEISSEAKLIGAINTLEVRQGKIIGHNTDYHGFGWLLRKNKIQIKDMRVIILGTGGASKSLFHYLKDHGVGEISFVTRNPEKARKIYRDSRIMEYNDLKNSGNTDIIINTTPLGMYPDIESTPLGKEILCKSRIAIDLIYNPLQTKFLRLASEIGLETANGLYMLVGQGVKSQEIWNGRVFDDEFYNIIYSEVLDYVK